MKSDVSGSKCAIYTRCATSSQTSTNGQMSISTQKQQCEEFAGNNGYIVAAHYSDAGRSGADIARRSALKSLIADTVKKPPKFDLLLIADMSRLSRNLADLLTISETFENQGTTIHFVNQGLSSSDSHFQQFAILNGMMDEAYRSALRDRIREANRASKKKFRLSSLRTDRRRGKKERS